MLVNFFLLTYSFVYIFIYVFRLVFLDLPFCCCFVLFLVFAEETYCYLVLPEPYFRNTLNGNSETEEKAYSEVSKTLRYQISDLAVESYRKDTLRKKN